MVEKRKALLAKGQDRASEKECKERKGSGE
jgi:hypothetical protein